MKKRGGGGVRKRKRKRNGGEGGWNDERCGGWRASVSVKREGLDAAPGNKTTRRSPSRCRPDTEDSLVIASASGIKQSSLLEVGTPERREKESHISKKKKFHHSCCCFAVHHFLKMYGLGERHERCARRRREHLAVRDAGVAVAHVSFAPNHLTTNVAECDGDGASSCQLFH